MIVSLTSFAFPVCNSGVMNPFRESTVLVSVPLSVKIKEEIRYL